MASEATTIGWANTITWGIVLIGWITVHCSTLSRERRKEKRDSVSRIIEEIKAIEILAVTFHTSDNFDPQSSDSLIWRISRVTRSLQRPPLKSLNIDLSLMVRFRREFTLQNTDASTFAPQAYNSGIIKGIRAITDKIIETIEAAKDKAFV